MLKLSVKKGDTVEVLTGKNRGKRGKVLQVFPCEGRLLVEGVNVVKRHTRPQPPAIPQGGILEKAKPVQASNVMVVCPQCNERTRTGKKVMEDKSRIRFCKSCQKEI